MILCSIHNQSYNVGTVYHTHVVCEKTEVQKGKEANYGSTNFQTQLSIQQCNAIGGSSTSSAILPLTLINILHRGERQRGGKDWSEDDP